jgi:hypothetical protein
VKEEGMKTEENIKLQMTGFWFGINGG